MKKILSTLMLLCMVVSVTFSAKADEKSEDIVILYTNDIHTYIDAELSYDCLSEIKNELKKQYKYVFLADAGDHIQGTAYGSLDKGESIIKMMNAAGYDVATLGNHEFDYGMDGCMNVIEIAEFPYISANFYNEKDGVRGECVLDSFKIFDCGEEKLAFIGITTPETFTKSTPKYFQDENGNYIYGISGGDDGLLLQQDVQKAIDEAKADGATKVIALGHLGVEPESKPWTSREVIAGISGMDAFIDGHSHTVMKEEKVEDKDGEEVLLTQTGEYFNRIGIMIIDSETDEIKTDFIECLEILGEDGETVTGYELSSQLYTGKDLVFSEEVTKIKDEWITEIDNKLGQKIGFTELVFDNYDAQGQRMVRTKETNSGDFAADALYYLFDNLDLDVDVAIMNGGGIRNKAITGEISYKTCKDMHTFGNVACLQTVTGQQLLDALEWGAHKVGESENGGFLQVSGLKYKVDTKDASGVKYDDKQTWLSGPEKYRVYDVFVYNKESGAWEALDVNASYNLAGYNYTLRELGDGYAMFDGAVNVLDYVMEDYMVLANYIKAFENGEIKAKNSPLLEKYPNLLIDYSLREGSGRIEIGESVKAVLFSDVLEGAWYFDDVEFVVKKGLFEGTAENKFSPEDNLTRAMLVTILYRAEGEPETNKSIPFSDVDMSGYYANAVSWAKQNDIISGVSENEFLPNENITREQMAKIIFKYAQFKGYDVSMAENTNILSYTDYENISEYAKTPIQYVAGSGIMTGKSDKTFNPKDYATRAEGAAILHRFFD